MSNDLFTALLMPFVDIAQNFVDASFTILSLFGFSAPSVSAILNSLLGIGA